MTGRVEGLFISAGSRLPMQALSAAELNADHGLAGDRKAKPGSSRQVLVMPAEVLDSLGLQPGMVRENITTRGLDVMGFPPGARLRVGEVLLEATMACTPCNVMDEVRPGLQEELRGQRGMFFRVIRGGLVKIGDVAETLEG